MTLHTTLRVAASRYSLEAPVRPKRSAPGPHHVDIVRLEHLVRAQRCSDVLTAGDFVQHGKAFDLADMDRALARFDPVNAMGHGARAGGACRSSSWGAPPRT